MSRQRRAKSATPLEQIYRYNRDISRTRDRMFHILFKEQNRGSTVDQRRTRRLEKVRSRMSRLTLRRNDELMRLYSNLHLRKDLKSASPKRPQSDRARLRSLPKGRRSPPPESRPPSAVPPLRVSNVQFKDDKIEIQMDLSSTTPDHQMNSDDSDDDDTDIIYPDGVVDVRPYKTIARYRRLQNQSTDFKNHPIRLGEDQTETVVLALDTFADQHRCQLIFTDQDHRFDNSIYRAACGVADLGSIHLLAIDAMRTATFQFTMAFDFHEEFQRSKDKVESFVMDVCQDIGQVLGCDANYIRLFSISPCEKDKKKSEVKLGLTSPILSHTVKLADKLQSRARTKFTEERALRRLVPDMYEYRWECALKYLRLHPNDLAPEFNYDYRLPSTPFEEQRGSHPYYFARGWYRHGLRVLHKYHDDHAWLGRINGPGEWAMGFHGTKSASVEKVVREGVKAEDDPYREEAVKEMGAEADHPGIYIFTKCDGGATKRSVPFTITTSTKQKNTFHVVFQCRVKPEKYTCHQTEVEGVDAWRYVEPAFIRPYSILLKKDEES